MTHRPKLERGEYASFPRVLRHGPQFQELSPIARHVFLDLKLAFGPSGIEVHYPELLVAEQIRTTGHPLELIEQAHDELRAAGWMQWERNVVWLVDHLRFYPSMSAGNPRHRTGIQNHVAGLPRLAIVDQFRRYYPAFFADPAPRDDDTRDAEIATPEATDTPSIGTPMAMARDSIAIPMALHSPSHQVDVDVDLDVDLDGEEQQRSDAVRPPSGGPVRAPARGLATAPPRFRLLAQLPDIQQRAVLTWLGEYYAAAPPDRFAQVEQQLLALLNGEAKLRKDVHLSVQSPERLARACRAMCAGPPLDKPDSAIRYLFLKLGDVSRESPTEAAQRHARTADRDDRRDAAANVELAEAWARDNPDAAAAIEADVRAECPGEPGPLHETLVRLQVHHRLAAAARSTTQHRGVA